MYACMHICSDNYHFQAHNDHEHFSGANNDEKYVYIALFMRVRVSMNVIVREHSRN